MLTRDLIDSRIGAPEEEYDVIVAGGGPAGIGAALAAAKAGAKTLLLEARGYLGGVATNAFWMPINRLLLNGESRGDIHGALVEKLRSLGPGSCIPGRSNDVDGDGLSVHPDFLRLALLELMEEFGCKYVLYSPVDGVEMEGSRIKAVTTSYKTQSRRYRGKVFIDCTGDGDLSYRAGARTETGREGDGRTMFVTLGFTLAGTDVDRFFSQVGFYMTLERVESLLSPEDQKNYALSPWYSFDHTTLPGVISVNNGGFKDVGPLDATRPEDITAAERGGIQVAHDFVRLARKYKIPGLEHCELGHTGGALGVRETRRVMGDYVVTMEDAQTARKFDDVVARRFGACDFAGADEDYKMVNGFGFPYRALLVAGVEGLLVAGRCGSCTHLGLAAGKSMGNMMEIGQAAGVAAALSARAGVTPRQLPYSQVQDVLRSWHVALD